jgi:tetratricopeptide (TPR) repeat protein
VYNLKHLSRFRNALIAQRHLTISLRNLPMATVAVGLLVGGLVMAPTLQAQQRSEIDAEQPTGSSSSSSSSSSSPGASESQGVETTRTARIAQPEAAGSAITLETSEPLFFLATALNMCGYDSGLAESNPVRMKVREELNGVLAGSAPARDARDVLCAYMRLHDLSDPARNVAQYVSLSIYITPLPEMVISADPSDLPTEALGVLDVLPLLSKFSDAVQLHSVWIEHRPEYEALIDHIHTPLVKMILDTNIFLHMPVSSYDGRRFLVLLEPMLAPEETNARYNGTDSVVVVSPRTDPPDGVPMDLIRHTYLHFLVEPLVVTRASSINRLQPLMKPVQAAPLEYIYKTDIVALVTECLIKAVEAQTMNTGIAVPVKPSAGRDRSTLEHYEAEMSTYDHEVEQAQRRKVDLDMRQGWVMVDYFYTQLGIMEKNGTSLKDNMGPMVYGMDVDSEQNHIKHIVFLPESSAGDIIRRMPRPLTGLDLAESKLMKGDLDGSSELADAALKANPDNAAAHYLMGRIDLLQSDPDGALDELTQAVKLSHDPRTVAWAHIYLGRMYDIARDPDDPSVVRPQRDKAVAEYRAALASRDSQTDTKAAAEAGIKQAFVLPKHAATSIGLQSPVPPDDDAPLDPTGKAEKDSYRPSPAQ